MGVAIVLQLLFYRPPNFRQLHGDERTRWQEVKRIDWVGMILLVAGLMLFLLGISWGRLCSFLCVCRYLTSPGGEPLPWTSARILGLVVSGGVTLIIFGFWEVYSGTPNPLVPMRFFRDVRGFAMLFIIGGVSGTVYVATAIIWPSQVA